MKRKILLLAISALFLAGCIKNDIPYPMIQVDFLSISAEGESSPATIDTKKLIVTLNFPEQADIGKVKITDFSITDGATLLSPDTAETLDLRTGNVKAVLSLYQNYEWTITANQEIERYFTVENQVGASVIDVPGKRVVAYVSKNTDISRLKVLSLKLGPADISTYLPEAEGKYCDFNDPIIVFVDYHGVRDRWTLYVKRSNSDVSTDRVDAWTNVAWAYGSGQDGYDNGFEYRKTSDTEWTRVPAEWVTHKGGAFTARIIHLEPLTEYSVRAYSGSNYGGETIFTTSGVLPIPNASFDDWHLDGKQWNPWSLDGEKFWDTGNRGATTLGDSNSVPTDEGYKGKGALLQTKFVGISIVGKLAAGNIYTGDFIRVDGTNGILNFGREFTGRPTRLRGMFKYFTSPIAYTSTEYSHLKGEPDTASIYIALTDWEQQFEIRTNPKNRQLFDPKDDAVIAYGALQYGYDVPEYTEFKIDLEYRSTSRVPRYIVIVASASKYGDFFTGGATSTLWLDELQLDWDYDQ